jgi:septum formation protein
MLVLASASPRRHELLAQGGYTFVVHPADIPEDPCPNEDPIAYVTRLARQKAEAVYGQLTGAEKIGTPDQAPSARMPERTGRAAVKGAGLGPTTSPSPIEEASGPEGDLIVLGADTTVTLDHHILGKPTDAADAIRMLRLLSGRTHRVITGIAMVTAARTEVAAEVTAVKFLTLSEEEIATYIATGEPMDKAGAYAIQGRAARWIPRIEGDYFNVVGLPIALVSTLLNSI